MKILIWFLKTLIWLFSICSVLFLNFLLSAFAGFGFGYLITVPAYFYIARWLCKKLDIQIEQKKTANAMLKSNDLKENNQDNIGFPAEKTECQSSKTEQVQEKQQEEYTSLHNAVKNIQRLQQYNLNDKVKNLKTSNTVRYCRYCGKPINKDTKKCTGCGKQFFKGFKLKTILSAFITSSLLISTIILGMALQEEKTDAGY